MDKIMYTEEWLRESNLIAGRFYVVKDGRVLLYLGRTLTGLYTFYTVGAVHLIYHNGIITFGNYIPQLGGLEVTIKRTMSMRGQKECLSTYKGIPKIYGELPVYGHEETYLGWYNASFGNQGDLALAPKEKDINTGFVSSKDLIPGQLYYSGYCWRSTWVYIGRNSKKEYLWYFISNEQVLLRMTAIQLLHELDKTKQNKKVKPLAMALTDPHASVCDGTRQLIEMNYLVDMSGITQSVLDRYS